MFYVEMLRVRITVTWAFIGLCALSAGTVVLGALFPDMHYDPKHQSMAFLTVGWTAALVAAVVASILGSSLATENCGHLEIAWTKPVSRTVRALGTFAIDLAAVIVIFGMTFAAAFLVASFLDGQIIRVTFDPPTLAKLGRFLLFPVAWFGMSQGLTSRIHGKQAGMVIGLSWPIAEGLSLLTAVSLALPFRGVVALLNYANPITYFPFWTFDESMHHGLRAYFGFGLTIDSLALAAIATVGLAVATLGWRRLEA